MVKAKVRKLLPIMISSWLLFIATNLGVTVLTSQTVTVRPLLNTILFAFILYAWSILNFIRGRRFAAGLMEFVIIVYTFGFISSIVMAISNLQESTGLLILATIGSFIGIVVNLIWFKTCSRLNRTAVKSTN
ncbi:MULTISPECIES: hypothetical protein [Lactobacillaceae]|uniref:hypothetical protein n=1 Tax=Lactobacillaceae TaxID=33958 RepID=UPI001456807B|nr:hypothetical protein [Lactobacillus sp. HBUAS51381]